MTEPTRSITFRGLRTVWRVLILAVVFYVWIAESHHPQDKHISPRFYASICVVSVFLIGTMFLMQKRSTQRFDLSSSPTDPKKLRGAYAFQLLLMGCSLALVLYGLVVRFSGATLGQTLPFYAIGTLLLLYFRPKQIGTGAR